ncbi:hypothetical protein BGZ59_000499 [Podila verticillata]|nr:hypothetical protein BGZ59_000499 [Podila verticillata]
MLTPYQQLEGIIRTREEEGEAARDKERPQDDISMNHRNVGVIIVEAGISGLTLGCFWKSPASPTQSWRERIKSKALMEKKFPDNAKPTLHLEVFNDDLESIMTFKNKSQEAAPTMYDMLLRRIPAHKLVLGQKVLGIKQGDNDAQVNTAQGYIESDIIVRADGAYISTRKRMYESMVKKQQLDPKDLEKLPYKYVSVLGQTEPLSHEEYQELLHEESAFQCVVGKDGYAWTTYTTESNSICWNVMLTLNKETSKIHNTFLKCEWGTEDANSMVERVRGFRIPNGDGTKIMGDLISKIPKGLDSKVTLEEMVFST